MSTMRAKRPKSSHPGRRGLQLGINTQSTDEAVQAMFKLTPEQSRKIIADTSPKPKKKRNKKEA
jgi:hypothetical protein